MLGFDNTITVYNSVYNPETTYNDYFRTVIKGVSWYSRIKAAAGNNGLVYDRLYQVRIPASATSDKVYTAPDHFTDPATQYTIKAGDIVLKGAGPPAPTDGNAWASLQHDHEEAFSVLGYRDNRRIGLKHIFVEGK